MGGTGMVMLHETQLRVGLRIWISAQETENNICKMSGLICFTANGISYFPLQSQLPQLCFCIGSHISNDQKGRCKLPQLLVILACQKTVFPSPGQHPDNYSKQMEEAQL